MAGLLNTAITGLQVSQTALKTTGHNIANANTDGYSRQKVEISTNPANQSGAGFIGNGATVSSVERIVDEFLVKQLRTDSSLNSELSAFNESVGQLDGLLSNQSTGLSQGLDRFFAVMENGADDPTSIPARQLIISEAENLSRRFNTLYERISDVGNGIDSKMDAAVNQINALASSIAKINLSISQTTNGDKQIPNDLMDQREEALRQLSELVSIDVVDQGDGLLNVSIGSGQALVIGGRVQELEMVSGQVDPQLRDVAYADRSGAQIVTNFISGGELGGLIDFRDGVLSESLNELGRVALVLSDTFNKAHRQGIDLNNQFGGDFFGNINSDKLIASRVLSRATNTPPDDRVMSVEIVDSSKLTASDYKLQFSSGDISYKVTRESDGAVVYSDSVSGSFPKSIEFDGIKFTFVEGSFQQGDRFLIQPTKTAARDIFSALDRPDQLALASPLVTGVDSGNLGNASISAGALTGLTKADGTQVELFSPQGEMNPPLLIRFTSASSYDVLDNSNPGKPVQLDPPLRNQPYVAGLENSIFGGDAGSTLVVANGLSLGISAAVSGAVPLAPIANGYPSEILTFSYFDPVDDSISQQVVSTASNGSAKSLASQLASVNGVSALARNEMTVSNLDGVSNSAPLQITLNGSDLIEYELGVVSTSVPDPTTDEAGFNRYLAARINQNSTLNSAGIYAVAGTNAVSGEFELRVFSREGDDFNLNLEASVGETLTVADYKSGTANLTAAGVGNEATVTVGGTVDITLASGYELSTNPAVSSLFGDSSASGFAKSNYLGVEVTLKGVPAAGDKFYLGFNRDGISDNRNALTLVSLSAANIMDDNTSSLGDAYGALVEHVGIKTNSAKINFDASQNVLAQTQELRDSVSAVNLDEEAANLIQFEQLYNANAQVIAVARDLFDRLIGIF